MVDKTRSESVGLNNTCAVKGSNFTAVARLLRLSQVKTAKSDPLHLCCLVLFLHLSDFHADRPLHHRLPLAKTNYYTGKRAEARFSPFLSFGQIL